VILPTDEFTGRLIITWPKSDRPALLPPLTILHDADTGEQITSVASFTLSADATENLVTAELTMLTDADGQPLASAATPILTDDGEDVRTGVFRWAVAEMRVAEAKS